MAPASFTARLVFLFRRLLSLTVDLTLIGAGSFLLWIQHPLFILPCGWAYYAACSAWLGQRTPGMRLAGLYLREVGSSPYVFATWRSPLCRLVMWGLPVTILSGGVGYLGFLLARRDGRTLHELASRTQLYMPEEA